MNDANRQPRSVETLIREAMTAAGCYQPRQVQNALAIWRDYCEAAGDPGAPADEWAAAVEYTIVRIDFVEGVTLKALAKRHGVASRAVAARFTTMQDALDILPLDTRYSIERIDVDEEEDPLTDILGGSDEGDEELEPPTGQPFAEVKDLPEFAQDVRDLIETGKPITWVVSVVSKAHPASGIDELQELVDFIQDIWNRTPREELDWRSPEEADGEPEPM